jgi:hypothetical protein
LEQAIQIAHQTKATHVLYKVAHGEQYLPGSAQAAQRIADAGLIPFGWMWLLLVDPVGEAQATAQAFQDGFEGFIYDSEAPCSNRFTSAQQLVEAVRALGLDTQRLYNCSFPNITHHRDLPYKELNAICKGGLMPMAYGSFFAPGNPTPWAQQAERVIDDWTYGHYEYWVQRWGYRPPLHPVLAPYHDEYGAVTMEPAEFQIWLDLLESHQPTFFSIFTAAIIPDNLLAPIRNFSLEESPDEETELPDQVWAGKVEGAVLYNAPETDAHRPQAVIYGTRMEVLGDRISASGKRWYRIRLADGTTAWVPVESVSEVDPGAPPQLPIPPAPPPDQLTHVWTEQQVNFRRYPAVRSDTLIGRLYPGARMRILSDPTAARQKLGQYGHWLNVEVEPNGAEGWIAAWYVVERQPPEGPETPLTYVRVDSDIGLNVRSGPTTDADLIWHVPDKTILTVLEDPQEAAHKVGEYGEWIHIQTPSLHEGYVAAWYLVDDVPPDEREPVADETLPLGASAWIFGIHGAGSTETEDFRHLFENTGKRGWVLFTDAIGRNPQGLGHNEALRTGLWNWAESGYGVMLRLNYGYEPTGTLPPSPYYGEFAATAARYAELYLKHEERDPRTYTWVIIIGNEQNNVREHPGGSVAPTEHITPQRYAQAFNLAYHAIKSVLPNATIVTGAVDPYNTWPWVLEGNRRYRPLDYFHEMLEEIDVLDGIALHAYTHGPVVDAITHKRVFTDPPLNPGTIHEHYYDFQAYRPFAEAVPVRWRDRPLYITETNHWVVNVDGSGPAGWINQNIGWIREAYAEVDRWNRTPHAQQIHALMIYRWQGDAWAIRDMGQVQEDFRMALANDYRWRK